MRAKDPQNNQVFSWLNSIRKQYAKMIELTVGRYNRLTVEHERTECLH